MAVFTQLSAVDVSEIANCFGLGPVHSTTGIEAGTINSNYRFVAKAGEFFVRVNEGKTVDDVVREASIVTWLAGRGLPAPTPVLVRSGEPYARCGAKIVSVFPWIGGGHVAQAERTAEHLHAVGHALALIHTAGADDLAVADSDFSCAKVAAGLRRLRGYCADAALFPVLDDLATELEWHKAHAGPAGPVGLIHGDLFPDNVLFDGDRLCGLLDFEQAARDSFAYDIAVCLLSWCYGDDFEPALAAGLLTGYQTVRPLDPCEHTQLFVHARAVAARFTMTRITDVTLNPRATAYMLQNKDYRRFYARLQRLREIGPSGLAKMVSA